MKPLQVTIERDGSDEIAGWINETDHFLLTTVGASEQEVLDNMRELVANYIIHEGAEFAEWRAVDAGKIVFEITYYK